MKLADILSGPEKWTQGTMAVTAKGNKCCYDSKRAACWCLVGALCRLNRNNDDSVYTMLRILRRTRKRCRSVAVWNDAPGRTWAEVAEVVAEFDR